MINFNVPPYVGDEITYIQDAIATGKICGEFSLHYFENTGGIVHIN